MSVIGVVCFIALHFLQRHLVCLKIVAMTRIIIILKSYAKLPRTHKMNPVGQRVKLFGSWNKRITGFIILIITFDPKGMMTLTLLLKDSDHKIVIAFNEFASAQFFPVINVSANPHELEIKFWVKPGQRIFPQLGVKSLHFKHE